MIEIFPDVVIEIGEEELPITTRFEVIDKPESGKLLAPTFPVKLKF